MINEYSTTQEIIDNNHNLQFPDIIKNNMIMS